MKIKYFLSRIHIVIALMFVINLLPLLLPGLSFSEDYGFDISEFEKKPFTIGGYAEFRPVLLGLDRDASFYKLRFFDRDEGDKNYELHIGTLLDLSFEKDITTLFFQPNILYTESYRESGFETTVFQGYLSLKPSLFLSIYAGKRSLKWGKGYAWNPVGFVERPKDSNDPDLAREGFIMLTADYTRSFDGAIKTVSFSPVLIPVYEHVNDNFGKLDTINIAGKIYLLLYDTDVDLLFLIGDAKPNRFGLDFSRNITANLEVHGEFAFIDNFKKNKIDESGQVSEEVSDVVSYLFGIRYLSTAETTYILEYYQNGSGFSADMMRDFYSFIDNGYEEFQLTGNESLLNRAEKYSDIYGRQNPMRHYLYLRISQKEPFDILYLTPAVTWITNLSDRSFSLSPEILYKGITNLEIRLKGGIISGGKYTEYGEKQNDYRIELRTRYYF
jgi:hypothetical protein